MCLLPAVNDCVLVRGDGDTLPYVSGVRQGECALGLGAQPLAARIAPGGARSFACSAVPHLTVACTGGLGISQIGRVKDIFQTDKGVEVQVAWYYRPEEAVGGRKVRGSRLVGMGGGSRYATVLQHAVGARHACTA